MKIAIMGATAYSSRELIKLLLRHPAKLEINYLGSRQEGELKISDIFPIFEGVTDLALQPHGPEHVPDNTDLVFLTLPHTVAMTCVYALMERAFRVIDFSADYRQKNTAVYKERYGTDHTDQKNLKISVYGLPELYAKEIAGARLVANPGCYPTPAILSLAPLVREKLIDPSHVVVDAKSGVSGAGNKPTQRTHFPECNENVEAYKIGVHGHEAEIAQVVSWQAGEDVSVLFVPHLIPMNRGILTTIYAVLKEDKTEAEIRGLLEDAYKGCVFVRVKPEGVLPRTKDVLDTNFCDIAVRVIGRKVVLVSAIDNLTKGAASQAVQNMNLMLGLDETAGLM